MSPHVRRQFTQERANGDSMKTLCNCGNTIWDGTLICDSCHERNKARLSGDSTRTMFILERPMYRVIVCIEGDDIDVDIVLTAKGKRYASARARGFHHWKRSDDEAIAEIMHARDNYMPAPKPFTNSKYSFDV